MASVVTVYSQLASAGSAPRSAAPSLTRRAARCVSPSVRASSASHALHAPPAGVRAPCSIVDRSASVSRPWRTRIVMSCTPNSSAGVVVLRGAADAGTLGGQPRGLVDSSSEQREHGLPHRSVPGVGQEAEVVGQAPMRFDRLLGGGAVAELEEIDDAPVDALQLRLAVARSAGRADQLVRYRETLLDVGRAPERDVMRVQRLEQRAPARCADRSRAPRRSGAHGRARGCSTARRPAGPAAPREAAMRRRRPGSPPRAARGLQDAPVRSRPPGPRLPAQRGQGARRRPMRAPGERSPRSSAGPDPPARRGRVRRRAPAAATRAVCPEGPVVPERGPGGRRRPRSRAGRSHARPRAARPVRPRLRRPVGEHPADGAPDRAAAVRAGRPADARCCRRSGGAAAPVASPSGWRAPSHG